MSQALDHAQPVQQFLNRLIGKLESTWGMALTATKQPSGDTVKSEVVLDQVPVQHRGDAPQEQVVQEQVDKLIAHNHVPASV